MLQRARNGQLLTRCVHRDVDMMNRSRDRRAPSTAAITVPMSEVRIFDASPQEADRTTKVRSVKGSCCFASEMTLETVA